MAKTRYEKRGHRFERKVLRRSSEGMDRKKPKHLEFRDAIDDALSNQPRKWNPKDPPSVNARKLFEAVREALPTWLNESKLSIFVSTGRALDLWHGIDGFFVFSPEQGIQLFATFDLKSEKHPDSDPKAEFVIEEVDLEDEQRLGTLSKEIAVRLAERENLYQNNLSPT